MLATLKPSLSTLAYRLAYAALALVAAVCLALLMTGRAHAAPAVDLIVDDLSANPERIAAGPDGHMWVTLNGPTNSIARIAADGTVKDDYNIPTLDQAVGIAAGPDGNMWVTLTNEVGRFDPDDPEGTATTFPAAGIGGGQIVSGPLDSLWAVNGGNGYRISTSGTVGSEGLFTNAKDITTSGGLLWATDFATGEIVSFDVDTVTRYPVGGTPFGIAGGPGGQIAYTNSAPPHAVGRLMAGGSPLVTPVTPGSDPYGMAFGPDGAYWFAQPFTDTLGRLTTDGEYTELGGLPAGSTPRYVAAGPGNTLWVTLPGNGTDLKKVARVSGVEPAVPTIPGPPVAPGEMPPILSKLVVTPKRFRVAKAPTAVSAAKRKRGKRKSAPAGTRIKFTLNYRATVKLTFERKQAGRRRRGKCVKPTRALRSAKRCIRYVKQGTLTRIVPRGGATSVPFSGRIGRKALAAGSYRLTAVATANDGRTSVPQRATFTVVAR